MNLVPLPPVATSPQDMALAAVICSALATVLLALLVLCVIYCKRQLLEKKPSGEFLHLRGSRTSLTPPTHPAVTTVDKKNPTGVCGGRALRILED